MKAFDTDLKIMPQASTFTELACFDAAGTPKRVQQSGAFDILDTRSRYMMNNPGTPSSHIRVARVVLNSGVNMYSALVVFDVFGRETGTTIYCHSRFHLAIRRNSSNTIELIVINAIHHGIKIPSSVRTNNKIDFDVYIEVPNTADWCGFTMKQVVSEGVSSIDWTVTNMPVGGMPAYTTVSNALDSFSISESRLDLRVSETRTDFANYSGVGYTLVHGTQQAIPANTLVDGSVVKMFGLFTANMPDYGDVVCALSNNSSPDYPSTSYISNHIGSSSGGWFPSFSSGTIKIEASFHIGAIVSGTVRRLHIYFSVTWIEINETAYYFYGDTSIDVAVSLYPHLAIDLSGSGNIGRKIFTAQISRQ